MKGEQMDNKSYWLNTKFVRYPELEKPCIKLHYCPYGQLVEEFPSYCSKEESAEWGVPEYPNLKYGDKLSCSEKNGALTQFGHDCPAHYHAEMLFVNEKGKGVIPTTVG
jgi:hypothetical protein